MSSSFGTIENALRSLMAERSALDVTGQNVANANTDGYTRQQIELEAIPAYTVPSFDQTQTDAIGQGVEIQGVRRTRDKFVDQLLRERYEAQGQWTIDGRAFQQLEVLFQEPSTTGLNSLLSAFWNAWQDVAVDPTNAGARSALSAQATSLVTWLRRAYDELRQQQADVDDHMKLTVTELNTTVDQVAQLNGQIRMLQSSGNTPNDLLDKRDLLLDRIAQIANVTITEGAAGVTVALGGKNLASGTTAVHLNATPDPANNNYAALSWADDSTAVTAPGGELQGALTARDQSIGSRIVSLQTLAGTIVDGVNAQLRLGYATDGSTGHAFFADHAATVTGVALAAGNLPATSITINGVTTTLAPTAGTNTPQQNAQALAQAINAAAGITVWGKALSDGSVQLIQRTAASSATIDITAADATSGFVVGMTANGAANGADNLALDPEVDADPGMIAASGAPGSPGDGSQARQASLVQDTAFASLGGLSIPSSYQALIAQLGIDSSRAKSMGDTEDAVVHHLEDRRRSLTAVSIDEETASLLKYQRAYQAGVRLISTVDSLLEDVVTTMKAP